MREKVIEHKLLTEVKKIGGLALKFVSPGYDGVPDRIVLLPGGKIGFVDNPQQIGEIIDEIQST